MTASAAERAERSRLPTLDAPTTQAVIELRKAIRSVRDLQRVVISDLSPAQQRVHARKIDQAQWHFREARLGLEKLLEEDA